jgi:alpha-amylase
MFPAIHSVSQRLVTGLLLVSLVSLFAFSSAATQEEWRTRSIYQVVTDRFAHANDTLLPPDCFVILGHYCGGTWRGIRDNLDYIENMGFDAIWISPVVGNLPQTTGDGQSYTSYWQQNLYALNHNFGTQDDLLDLISEVHARGMLLMLDIVVNHMGYYGPPESIDYSVFWPFNDQKYFHDYCSVDDPANHTNAEECWLGDGVVPLADLRTEDQDVQDMFGVWIHEMVQNYSIDGLRIDTAINVNPSFFTDFVKAAGVFATGETMTGNNLIACTWENTVGSILNYPIYYTLIRAFQDEEGSINDLVETIESTRENCNDPTVLGSFSEVRTCTISSQIAYSHFARITTYRVSPTTPRISLWRRT